MGGRELISRLLVQVDGLWKQNGGKHGKKVAVAALIVWEGLTCWPGWNRTGEAGVGEAVNVESTGIWRPGPREVKVVEGLGRGMKCFLRVYQTDSQRPQITVSVRQQYQLLTGTHFPSFWNLLVPWRGCMETCSSPVIAPRFQLQLPVCKP